MGLHRALALCMDHCAEAELADDGWFKTVLLAGGTACLPGLPGMLQSDIYCGCGKPAFMHICY